MLARICLFLAIVFFLLGAYLVFERTNPNRLSFETYIEQPAAISPIDQRPERILIQSLSIDLPVIPAEYNPEAWDTTTQGVSYLVTSPLPGDAGNSIFYGHNWPNLLGRLPKIRPGERIEILFTNGEKRRFTVSYTAEVRPKEGDILLPSQDKRITIYTCTGFFDEKRFVAVAILD